ncbi:hypothetical protein BIY23_02780 [Wolbachia pipientis]|uniref:P44/Msp2 family outer membrane protein n=1 Tax=Wolbachia pipientis TaxID=955 RepID=A0A1E7QJG1_WOLPI|nr:hypothetical protein [Wolbachia pipientis]OEY86608.1 hypothetical protein BIY23_02780 [Wolbachia pipientis]
MSIECKKSSFCKSFVVIYAMLLFSQQSMANTFYFGLDCHKPLFEWTGPVTVKESGAVETNYTFDARNLAVLINIDTKKITNDNSISILHPHFYSARLGHQSKINNTVSYMVELEGISYQSNSTYSTYRVNHIDTPDMQTNIHNLSGIVNAYFSWQLNSFSLINPYIGAGVGAVYIHRKLSQAYLPVETWGIVSSSQK